MEKINGGLSNEVFKYKNLIFKFYNYSQLNLNYNWEQTIQTKCYLSGINTPKIHQPIIVNNKLFGRVEDFIESKTISLDDFKSKTKECATLLKQIHNISWEGLNDVPCFFNYLNDWTKQVAELKSFDYPILNDFEFIYKSGQEIINKCKKIGGYQVISHNDFQQLNILADNFDNNKWYIIDFEYSSLNYPYYDIANYFAECAMNNFELKYYPEKYPGKNKRNDFYSCYYESNQNFDHIDEIVIEFSKLVEYTWFIWSIIKYHNTKSSDYLDYGVIRKNNFIKLIN